MRGVNKGSAKLRCGQISLEWSSTGTNERFRKSKADAGSVPHRQWRTKPRELVAPEYTSVLPSCEEAEATCLPAQSPAELRTGLMVTLEGLEHRSNCSTQAKLGEL